MINLGENITQIILRNMTLRFGQADFGFVREVKVSIEKVSAGNDSMMRPAVSGYIVKAEWEMLQNNNHVINNMMESARDDGFDTLYVNSTVGSDSFKISDVKPVYDFTLDGNGKISGIKTMVQRSATFNEVIEMLTNVNEISAETDVLYYDTQQKGWQPIYKYMRPKLVYYKGKYNRTYITWNSGGHAAGTATQTNYVMYYDHDTGEFSGLTDVGPTKDGTDEHHVAAIEVTDDGYILVAYDPLNATGSAHNAGIRILRSANPEDISAFNTIGMIQENGSDAGGGYPWLVKRKNNVILVGFRGGGDGEPHYTVKMAKSEDGGLTWGEAYTIIQHHTDSDFWAYNSRAAFGVNQDIRFYINNSNRNVSKSEDIFVLRSADGEVWTNEQKTFSKNVINDGHITPAEASQYFNLASVPTASGQYVFMRDCGVSKNNMFFAFYTHDDTVTVRYYLAYIKNGEWQKVPVDFMDSSYLGRSILVYDDDMIDIIVKTNQSPYKLLRYRTNNRGQTWRLEETIINDNPNGLGYSQGNQDYLDSDKYLLAVEDRKSNYHDIKFKFYNRGA